MNQEPKEYPRIISLKWLALSYLKLWRSILAAVVIGALVLGGVQLVRDPGTAVSSTVVTENTKLMEANNKTIAEYLKLMDANTQLMEDGQDEIEVLEDTVALKTQQIANQEAYLADCEATLATLQGMTASTELTQTELFSQISEFNARIQNTNTQLYSLNNELRTAQRTLEQKREQVEEELPLENQTTELQLITLQMENAALQAEMEPKPVDTGLGGLVKYAVIGGLLGAVAVGCWLVVKLWLGNRVYLEADLKASFGLYELGSMAVSHSRHGTGLDLLLERLGGERRDLDENEAYRLIAARLQSVNNGETTYLLTGTVSPEALEKLRSGLAPHLPAGYQINVAANPLHDPDSVLALKNAHVVLAEEKDVSSFPAVRALVEQLEAGNAVVTGYVTL